jgi:hypothetical protein
VGVDSGSGDIPEFMQYGRSESGRDIEWSTLVESDNEPDVILKIVNPGDATIYSFDMDVEESGGDWYASYEKTMNNATVYTYWFEANNSGGTQNSEVLALETE